MKIDFLDLRESNSGVEPLLAEAACRVIRSGRYLRGEETRAFESELAAACGGGECVACSNGLDAIRLILRGYMELGRLRPGDEVIVAANTYIASVLPITEFGLCPVLCEPDPATMNLDFGKARRLISDRTGAIMIVHLYGTPCWDEDFAQECHRRGILLIEDNAQAIGAMASEPGLNGTRHTGMLGDAAAFSFYPTKNIGALGDAGAILTPDKKLAEATRALANYGSDTRYHNIYRGYNCRMDEIQAAMLRVQLSRLDEITRQRNVTASLYDHLITNPRVIKPRVEREALQVWHQYVVRTADRDTFRRKLAEKGIGTDVHYAVPPHLQPCYLSQPAVSYPITEKLADTVVSLPIATVGEKEAEYVAEIINGL